MIKKLFFILLVSSLSSNMSYAHDNERINKLEEQVEELKAMLAIIVLSSSNTEESKYSGNEKWFSKENWRKLKTGILPEDVRHLLGEPEKINGGDISTWYYSNSGSVHFYQGKVDRWSEPKF